MRILHLSDLHLDRRFAALPEAAAAARREDLRSALRRCLVLARSRRVDAVTVGGDLWEEAHVTPATRAFVADELASLAPTPVLLVGGNHDPVRADGGGRAAWPPNVRAFPGGGPTELRVGDVSVWGVSWTAAGLDISRLPSFRVPRDGRTHLLLVHGAPRGLPHVLAGPGAYGELDPGAVARCGFRLCLAGHVHDALLAGRLAYPGSPEPLGWTGRGRNGCLVVELAGDEARIEAVALGTLRWLARGVDCTGAASAAELAERVTRSLPEPDPAAVVRLRLTGRPLCGVDVAALARPHRARYAALVVRDRTARGRASGPAIAAPGRGTPPSPRRLDAPVREAAPAGAGP